MKARLGNLNVGGTGWSHWR